MPRPALKSRSLRRTLVTLPGGRKTIHYEKKSPQRPHCGSCGTVLSGVARGRKTAIGKLPVTWRRPTRPYGGNLCSACSREAIKNRFVYNK